MYYVYMHVSPSGKRYIGITGQKPEMRWKSGGVGYKANRHFWNAIQKYGWDSFTHEILFSDLPLQCAQRIERTLIQQYQSDNPKFGYNQTNGGEYSTQIFNEAVRKRLSESKVSMWKNPEIRSKIVSKLIGHPVSDETKRKLSNANKGRKHTSPSKLP